MKKKSTISKEKRNLKKQNHQNLAFIAGIVTVLLITLIGGSYAFFSIVVGGVKKVTVEVGTFEVSFVDHEIITLENAYPMSDTKGMTNPSYQFTVKNTGTVNALYDLSFEEQSITPNTLNKKYIKYSIKEGDGEWSSPKLLSELNNLVFISGKSLNAGTSIDYQVKIWLDNDAGNEAQGKEFKARLVLNAVQGNASTNDTTPPEIKLNGSLSMNIKQGSTFTDPGVEKVTDDRDTLNKNSVIKSYQYYNGVTTENVGSIDTTKLGVYYIYYKISDISGNEGVVVRTVNVYKPDTNPPVMTLVGESVQTVELGEEYTELGASALDPEEGDLSHNIVVEGTVNTNLEGTYIIKYLITDQSGNTSSITRTVIVKEITYTLQAVTSSTVQNYYKYKGSITSIEFQQGTEIPDNAIEHWKVQTSESEGIIQAYVIDDGLGTSTYKLYIQAKGNKIYANANCQYLFYNFSKLTNIENIAYLDTSKVTAMPYMFQGCSSLTSLDLSNFDTSNVTTMIAMFYNCINLSSLNVSQFDTSKVTTMASMFLGCSKLENLDLSSFNTSSVTSMASMFGGCSILANLNVSNFSTGKVTTMASMFYNCNSLVSLDLSNLNTSSVITMESMFYGFKSLAELDFSSFDTSNVTSMYQMFNNCAQSSLDLSTLNTHSVTTMASMFNNSKVVSLNLSGFNTSKVTIMSSMFATCTNLINLDVSSFDTSNVTQMGNMFISCSKLVSLDLSNFDTSKVSSITRIFWGCSNLTSLNVSSFDTSNVTSMFDMFNGCSKLTTLDVSSFDTSKVTALTSTFRNCSSLTVLDVSNFNTSNVTSMSEVFYGCSKLTNLDLSNFNTSKVTTTNAMFYGCSKLTNIDLSSFNTSSMTIMSSMFSGCSTLTNLDLSHFDTSNVTTMYSMFYGCSKLTNVNLSSFNTSNVTTMAMMFSGCSILTNLDLSSFDTSKVTTMQSMFYNTTLMTEIKASSSTWVMPTNVTTMFSGSGVSSLTYI